MLDVHIYDVPDEDAATALMRAQQFAAQFPDRIGIRQCAVYGLGTSMAVYRTRSGRIVVRGNNVKEAE